MLFTQIAQNKRNTRWVLVGYGLLLIAITILFAQVSWQVALGFALFGLGYVWYFYYHATRYLMRVTNAQAVSREDAPSCTNSSKNSAWRAGCQCQPCTLRPTQSRMPLRLAAIRSTLA